jgi:hypothetical protein
VTDEGKKETESWVKSKDAKYAYAYDKGGKIARWFGVSGIPDAVLIDPTGKIVWRGHPASLEESTIEANLKGALERPLWDLPASAKAVGAAVQKRQIAKALAEAEKLGPEGEALLSSLRAMVKGRLESVKSARDAKDFLAAQEQGERAAKDFAGLPEGDEIARIVEQVKGDKEAQKVIRAQAQIRDALSERIKKADYPKIEKQFRKILEELAGTGAARDAEKGLEELDRRRA